MIDQQFSYISEAAEKIFRLHLKAATEISGLLPDMNQLFAARQLPRTESLLPLIATVNEGSRMVMTDRFSLRWQVLRLDDHMLLAGPYRASRMDAMPEAQLLHLMDNRHDQLSRFIAYFSDVPVLSDDTVLQIISSAVGMKPDPYYDRLVCHDLRLEQKADLHTDRHNDMPIDRRDLEFDYMHAVGISDAEEARKIVLHVFSFFRKLMGSSQALPHSISTCAVYRTMARTAARQAGVPAPLLDAVTDRYRVASIMLKDPFDGIDLVLTMTDEICRLVGVYRHSCYTGPVRQAACYVDMCFQQELSVTGIAERLQIQQSRLSAEFVRQTGMSLTDYITQKRLEYACSLLRLSDEPVTAICTRSGFSDCSYFTKLFRKAYGVTPSAYRQNRD